MSKILDHLMISAFLEVTRTGSLGSAAKNLCRSQPLLTHHIRRLEDILGCVLFDRSPRGAILTAQGKVFLPFAKRLMAVSDQAERSMASLSGSNTKKLRIFISEDLVGEAFLKALAEKHSLLQQFDLEIAPAGEAPSAKAFERGEVDFFSVIRHQLWPTPRLDLQGSFRRNWSGLHRQALIFLSVHFPSPFIRRVAHGNSPSSRLSTKNWRIGRLSWKAVVSLRCNLRLGQGLRLSLVCHLRWGRAL